ncbi:neuropeptide CCHamide-2 [Hyposmocoma kahamanoa]|uniref:neuropeptide CCHamide-2 n=1 Tax=Hyposmocoma kahamanoa TaxID=1477025 RepID=UPI000E6D9203|nr:neuropeptide CCHamide-2 [Hyposmocoma kahamanoa]
MAHICITLAFVAVLLMSQEVSAKRGCSAFGHSCWGGHGKRSLDSSGTELEIGGRLGQEETPPHPGYPNSGYGLLPYGDDMIPVRNGGAFDHDENAREQLKFKLRNIVKHWMENYRRQQNDDAYVLENM